MSEAARLFDEMLDTLRPKGDRWRGCIIGDFSGNIDAPLQGWKYVRVPIAGSGDYSLAMFPGQNVSGTAYNTPVIIEYDALNNQRIIVGPDVQGLGAVVAPSPAIPDPGGYTVPAHAWTHQKGGPDQMVVYEEQLSNLQVSPSTTNTQHVVVSGGLYVVGGALIKLQTTVDVDLSSYFPASGVKYVWVTMTAAGAAVVVDPSVTSVLSLAFPSTANYVVALVMLQHSQPIGWTNIKSAQSYAGTGLNWRLLGNDAVDASVHFLGSVNNADVVFKRNNTESARLTSTGMTLAGSLSFGTFIDMPGISNPAAPSAGHVRFHAATTQGFTRFEQDNEATTNIVLGRDNVFIVRNTSGAPITHGASIYVTGSTGTTPTVALAKADSLTTLPAVGIALDTIADNAFGQCMKLGVHSGHDTSSWGTGDQLYVSATIAGALTNVRPTYPNYVQRIGSVLNSGIGDGSMLITTAPFIGGLESGTTSTVWTAAGVVTAKPTGLAGIRLDPNSATGDFTVSLSPANLTGNHRVTFGDVTGTAALGAGTLTNTTTNDVTVAAHTHAITGSTGLIGAGTAQYQILTTGANPYPAGWSDFFVQGTTGGKTVFAVTNTKVLTFTATDTAGITFTGASVLTVPAAGTATLGTGIQYQLSVWSGTNTVTGLGALGSSGAVLQSAGAGANPAWSANTLSIAGNSTINGSLVGSMTGGGTVATGGFTLTVLATGTSALLGIANIFTATQTIYAAQPELWFDGPGVPLRSFVFASAGLSRWYFRANNTAESGGNAGSDFVILARNDAGGSIGTALTITRSTMDAAFGGGVSTASGKFIDALTNGSTGGLRAGASSDVLWYRQAADKWGTPDSVHITGADSAANLRVAGATGLLRLYGYYDATIGTTIQAMNTAESGYVPLTLDGSVVLIRSSGLHVGGTSDPGDNNLLVDGTATITGSTIHTAKITTYNNIVTEGYGIPAIVDNVALTNQGADIAATNYTNAGVVGEYEVSIYTVVTTADATAGIITVDTLWNDGTAARTYSNGVSLTATNTDFGVVTLRIHLGSGNIQYRVTNSGSYGTAKFALYLTCKRVN